MRIKKQDRKHLVSETGLTSRGSYILGQALAVAISVMETAEYPEHSNIADMKAMQDLFMPYPSPLKAGLIDHEAIRAMPVQKAGGR